MRWHELIEKLWYSDFPVTPLKGILSIPWKVLSDATATRASSKALRVPSVVVSTGNLVSGGTGKTPFTIWLAKKLHHLGIRVSIVARSFGNQCSLTHQVESPGREHSAYDISGDEPLLMRNSLGDIPVWVSNRKWYAVLMAYIHHSPDVILIDDGFQHRRIIKDMELLLFDAGDLWGNGILHPFGPLREPLHHLAGADVVVITGIEEERFAPAEMALRRWAGMEKPFVKVIRKIKGIRLGGRILEPSSFKNVPICAFCGIARPARFFRLLELSGFNLKKTLSFPDHYRYRNEDLHKILEKSRRAGKMLIICTEKDYYKLPLLWKDVVGVAIMDMELVTPVEVVMQCVVEPIVHAVEERKCTFRLF
ncbi:tetraacyldisaccharide 4'-kinase [Thermodesulforhabdus norvegica]|uniref:Tetraacyldisaccharide 4'-kinase n=1 Tax=Thermodesulforhabdus norvegica TaxID=39841 RepID=A0A1I4ST89_9BACT|nr:tetraacyldisaccharide 4'-kinase [Thermodesulforhabdus norvegica]SFM67674.1 lipid-A-disaccharide kinase [Thermodesulforhabdus norvegica]